MVACVGGGAGGHAHKDAHTHSTHLGMRACAHMLPDLALLAWPPQVPLSVRQSADVRAAHSSKHCGPGLFRPDEHVRGPPHAHTWPVRAVLSSLLWPSCVLFRICPPRARFACVCAVCMCVVCARARVCVCVCVCVRARTYSHTTLEGPARDTKCLAAARHLMRAKRYL